MMNYSIEYLRGVLKGMEASFLIMYDCQENCREEVKRLRDHMSIVENEIKLLEEDINARS